MNFVAGVHMSKIGRLLVFFQALGTIEPPTPRREAGADETAWDP